MEAAQAGLVSTRFGRAKRQSTLAIDEGRISLHIVPLMGNRIAATLTRHDVQRMADDIAAGKTAAVIKTKPSGVARVTGAAGNAARIAGLLGGIFTWVEKRGFVSEANPCRRLDLRADRADRALSAEEIVRLGGILRKREAEAPMAVAALRLIALTGLRRGEAYGLRWSEIDFDGSCLRLSETKSGCSIRAKGADTVKHLRSLPRYHPELVFPNVLGSGPADLVKRIAVLLNEAGLRDARGHDLRRTFASLAADQGYSDATRQGVTAKHYIRRPDAALIAAADRELAASPQCSAGWRRGIVLLAAQGELDVLRRPSFKLATGLAELIRQTAKPIDDLMETLPSGKPVTVASDHRESAISSLPSLKEAVSQLQSQLAVTDLLNQDSNPDIIRFLVKTLQRTRVRMDGSKNHKRPHVHVDYGNSYHTASYAIDNGERIAGKLDGTYDRDVRD